MLLTFGVIFTGITLYVSDKIPMEITSLSIVAFLLLLFYFYPHVDSADQVIIDSREILAGFADPALFTIISLLVVGNGLLATGALDAPARILIRFGRTRPKLVLYFALVSALLISGFLNDTPVVVLFIPILVTMVKKLGVSPSQYLMPLSFVAILGGMTTLMGSSTNLLVASGYQSLTNNALGFFDFTIPGAFLASIGIFYVLLIAPRLLPHSSSDEDGEAEITGKQFLVHMTLGQNSSLVGKHSMGGMFPDLSGLTVQRVKKKDQIYLPPFDDITLEGGDDVVIAVTRDKLTRLVAADNNFLADIKNNASISNSPIIPSNNNFAQSQKLVEVIVAPSQGLDGTMLKNASLSLNHGCKIIGVQRRSRMSRSSLEDIRLNAGDTLLVHGNHQQIRSLRLNKNILLMEWSLKTIPNTKDMWKSLSIFGAIIAMSATGLMPISIAALTGALLMLLSGCISLRRALQSINAKIFFLIGAALAMGTALQATGGAAYVAMAMIELLQGYSVPIILSCFFLLVIVMTNILSNNATAVLFTPIAINIATELSVDPYIFVTTLIFAANCSFATPMGYQTNLLVLGPGNYKFSDFMKVGIPLILLLWVSYSLFAPWYYDL